MLRYLLISLCLLLSSVSIDAQSIRINEVMSSNASFLDDDGDTPDWIELYNYGNTEINLEGMSISDDVEKPQKWVFPSKVLKPDSYLIIWASDKDRKETSYYRTLIKEGDEFKYLIPKDSLFFAWLSPSYDDSGWESGPSGFGYGDGDDATQIPVGSNAVYLRKDFFISELENVDKLFFEIDFDDGFFAYINANYATHYNMRDVHPAYNSYAKDNREATMYTGGTPMRFELENFKEYLREGNNTLSIQVHNVTSSSTDLTAIPFLLAKYKTPSTNGTEPVFPVVIPEESYHTNFKISSSGESLYLYSKEGTLVDDLTVVPLSQDLSYGHTSDPNKLSVFTTATPGEPNFNGDTYEGQVTSTVNFSHDGGIVDPLSLTLSGNSNSETIRYTLDGSTPSVISSMYSNPLSISKTTVVSAAIFKDNHLPSQVQSRSYLFDIEHEIPIISLVIDPGDFFGSENGIYAMGNNADPNYPFIGANFWEDIERPVSVGHFDKDGNSLFQTLAGVKIFGRFSRTYDQRSLSLFFRKRYEGDLDFPLFNNIEYSEFRSVVLRNSGSDWLQTCFRDAFLTGLMENTSLEYQAYQPVATYINGNYWGLYNIREKVNEHFLASKSGEEPDDINIVENDQIATQGSGTEFFNLVNFIENNDLKDDNNYKYVSDQLDLENFIIYNVAQIYFDNQDWPAFNRKCWKGKNGKWKYILFDTDFGFGLNNVTKYYFNTLAYAFEPNSTFIINPPWSTLMLRKLSENIVFRNDLVNRFADEMNSTFLIENISSRVDEMSSTIAPEIEAHFARWNSDPTIWSEYINDLKVFGENRPVNVKQHILDQFDLPAYHKLTIYNQQNDKGTVLINNRIAIENNSWSGDYFQNVPVTITAVPMPDYKFSHWSGASTATTATITLNMTQEETLVPHFTTSVSTNDTDKNTGLSFYPSPAKDNVVIEWHTDDMIALELINYESKLVDIIEIDFNQREAKRITYNLSNLPVGIYFFKTIAESKPSQTFPFNKI